MPETILNGKTVGPGGSPDENGETTIDALVMNGVMHMFECADVMVVFLIQMRRLNAPNFCSRMSADHNGGRGSRRYEVCEGWH